MVLGAEVKTDPTRRRRRSLHGAHTEYFKERECPEPNVPLGTVRNKPTREANNERVESKKTAGDTHREGPRQQK